jgi:hypothetical protein
MKAREKAYFEAACEERALSQHFEARFSRDLTAFR